jgi:hypothetical protein
MKTTFKKGQYYIGDLCYPFTDKEDQEWSEFLSNYVDMKNATEFMFKGHKCAVGFTAYGDGAFRDENDREYYVDAGSIGIMPIDAMPENYKTFGGHVIDFKRDFTVSINHGVYNFDGIIIKTR